MPPSFDRVSLPSRYFVLLGRVETSIRSSVLGVIVTLSVVVFPP